jgi:hypothetical protein
MTIHYRMHHLDLLTTSSHSLMGTMTIPKYSLLYHRNQNLWMINSILVESKIQQLYHLLPQIHINHIQKKKSFNTMEKVQECHQNHLDQFMK